MSSTPGATAKSARTRAAIETAARDLFAINGFERTTVREIGARAGIDPAMVIRYFGGKEALFSAVAKPDLQMPDLSSTDSGAVGEILVRHFLEQWEAGPNGSGLAILLRSAASNEEAAERLKTMFRTQVLPAIAPAGTAESAGARAGLVASQILGLAFTRYVLKIPPVVDMSIETIVREIGPTIQRYATSQFEEPKSQ